MSSTEGRGVFRAGSFSSNLTIEIFRTKKRWNERDKNRVFIQCGVERLLQELRENSEVNR